jgi:hypothetical protein
LRGGLDEIELVIGVASYWLSKLVQFSTDPGQVNALKVYSIRGA